MTRRAHPRYPVYLAAFCVALVARSVRGEVPLFQQEPYDEIVLDELNDNAVLQVFPLDFPDRRKPDPFPKGGKIEVRLLDRPESRYEVLWNSIEHIFLFNELVLKKANELVKLGRLDEAYDYFDYLLENEPKLSGLDAAIGDYLYEEAKASQVKGRYHEALAVLRELYDHDRQHEGLQRALGVVTETMVEQHLADDNYWTARQMLRNLAKMSPDHAVVAKWEGKFRAEAAALLDEGRKAKTAGDLREAHRCGRELMRVWPDLPEGREFVDAVQREYPRVVVGVTLPAATDDPAQWQDWAVRRSSPLTCQTLMQFVGRGTEGGEYYCPFGEIEIQELGLRLALQVDPQRSARAGAPGLTGYELARQLLALAEPGHPGYRRDWSELHPRVSVREVYGVDVDIGRPHVRPEALLRTVVVDSTVGSGSNGASGSHGASASCGAYTVESRSEEEVVYVANPGYSLGPRQPREIVERYYRKEAEALSALERRQIDVLDRVNPWDLDKFGPLKDVLVEPYGVPSVHCLVPNVNRPFTGRREFRRAIEYGIPRDRILQRLLRNREVSGCQVISGPFSPGIPPDDPLDYAYDRSIKPRPYQAQLAIALAQVALLEVAEAMKKQGVEVDKIPEIVLAHPPHEIARVACQSIQRQLGLIDIPVTLRELPGGVPATIPDDVDLLYVELAMCEPVVDARRLLGEEGLSGGSSTFMSQALRQLDEATDWAQVAARLRYIHWLAQKETAVIPLWQLVDHFAYHRSLKGLGSGPVSLYQNVETWEPAAQYVAEGK